ncbi:caleosin domain containing protein [Cordyceps militaris CM01]|uniref:Caleosin domain containing protein n=1 Tax=Cordyceps militaris (strain CM01) TaxID=983644 RepID=G3JTA5_CORMM|nr:caleosin domain containing protein [Cordyceps militaris CM01]EGX88252.1 caleosin domain containing protein [Cordyceps militaris CM01]
MPTHKDSPGDRSSSEDGDSEDVVTSIPQVPVTVQRPPFIQSDEDERLPNAARANTAPSYDHPKGTTIDDWSKRHKHQTVLQQHCEFFDRDKDGIVWPSDTYVGFRRLGFSIFFSVISLLFIHANLSYATVHGRVPDPLFRIYLDSIHKAKHGSDSNAYDTEGRFRPQSFEDIFSKYATDKESLTAGDIVRLLRGQRLLSDPIGWGGAAFEWFALYLMISPADGRLKKEDVRMLFDGSLFYHIAAQRLNEQVCGHFLVRSSQQTFKPTQAHKTQMDNQASPASATQNSAAPAGPNGNGDQTKRQAEQETGATPKRSRPNPDTDDEAHPDTLGITGGSSAAVGDICQDVRMRPDW